MVTYRESPLIPVRVGHFYDADFGAPAECGRIDVLRRYENELSRVGRLGEGEESAMERRCQGHWASKSLTLAVSVIIFIEM